MDGSSWKRILFHWANQSGLFERTYYNIDQTDVEAVFERFRGRMTTPVPQAKLIDFLKAQYYDFQLHLDDDNNLSSSDYMYIYSLLLHYSCVKSPEPYFHGICQGLPEQFQQAIASFFKILLESVDCSKETLRKAISSSAPKSPLQYHPVDSPLRTPRGKPSPPTPKTNMIEERTKELHSLKAQLESERYEKGFLEVQLKQNEDKIQKLAQDQKRHLAEIYNLKNELLAKNTENCSPNKNLHDEQIKKRLRKDIAEKQETILNLRENLEVLGEEKTLLNEKLIYAEKQVNVCLEKTKEMDYTINELKSEIEKRDLAIQSLTETKNDLEIFISETRSSGGRNDLNLSAECLDISLSRTTNSSASISSPENLGVSVVDIRLREKECENVQLIDQIERTKSECSKLSKHVCELLVRYSSIFDICNENLIVTDDTDLTQSFIIFENYIEKMIETYTAASQNLKTANEENADLKAKNVAMNGKINEIEDQFGDYKKRLAMLSDEKLSLEVRCESLESQSDKYEETIKKLGEEHVKVATSFSELNETYEKSKKFHELQAVDFAVEKSKLQQELVDLGGQIGKLKDEKQALEVEKTNFEQRIRCLLGELTEKTERVDQLEELNENLLSSIGSHVQTIRQHERYIDELRVKFSKLEETSSGLLDGQDKLLTELQSAQNEIESLDLELKESRLNYEREQNRSTELSREVSNLRKHLNETETIMKNEHVRRIELETELADSSTEIVVLSSKIGELVTDRDQLASCCQALKENIADLNEKCNGKDATIACQKEERGQLSLQMEKEIEALKEEHAARIAEFEADLKELNRKVVSLLIELNDLQQRVTESNQKLEAKAQEFESLQLEKANIEERLQSEKETLQQNFEMLEAKSNETETAIRSMLKFLLASQQGDRGDDGLNTSETENPIKCLKERLNTVLTANNDLEKSGVEIRAVIADLKKEMAGLRKSGEEFRGICNNLTSEVAESELKVKSLEAEKEALKGQVNNLTKDVNMLQENIKQQTETAVRQSDKLTKKVVNLTSKNNKLLDEISLLKDREDKLIENVEKLTKEIETCEQAKMKLKEQLEFSRKQLSDRNVEYLELEEKFNENATFINSLKVEIENLKGDLEIQQQIISEQDGKIAELQKEKSELADTVIENHSQISEKENELRVAREQNDSIEKELQKLQSAAKLCETQLEQTVIEQQMKITQQEDSLASVEAALNEKQETIKNYQKKLQAAEEEQALIRSELKKVIDERIVQETINKGLHENIAELESQIQHSQTVNTELLAKIDELKCSASESADRETDYINLQLKYVATCAEKERLVASKQRLEETRDKLTKRVERLSLKLGEVQAVASKLEKSNSESWNEIETMRATVNRNKAQNDELQNKLKSTRHELEITKAKAINLQKSYDEEKNKNSTICRQFEDLRIRFDSRESELKDQNGLMNEMRSHLAGTTNDFQQKIEQLQRENKSLVEKLEAMESTETELRVAKESIDDLVKENTMLNQRMEEVTSSEENFKETTSHIDNIKHELELKVEKLSASLDKMSASLESAQVENMQLKKVNSQLEHDIETLYDICDLVPIKKEEDSESSRSVSQDAQTKFSEIIDSVKQLNETNQQLQETNSKLATNLETSRDYNSQLDDKLSKLALKLDILEKQNHDLARDMRDLQQTCDTLRKEKAAVEDENRNARTLLNELETRQNEILHEHVVSNEELLGKLENYEFQIKEKSDRIESLEKKLDTFKSEDRTRLAELSTQTEQLVELERKFKTMEQHIKKEKDVNEKAKKDLAIFQAKLYKNRQQTEEKEKAWEEERGKLKTELRSAEERIKESRLEMEGKLEKMKSKMKSLYNEEVTKIKNKYEREIMDYKSKVEVYAVKNQKYDDHVRKLAKQVFQSNETILELQKQNRFMETKLKDLETMSQSSLRRQSQFPSQLLGSNLRMEDEEGELFNNTYLTDLKNGRMSPLFGRDSVSVNELHYRNSLAPRHLRSTYIAQYPEHHLQEDDIKDIPINLDDSLSSLLYNGQRKKMSGTTSYKKPGPPTPSKNGGRLSFGGGNSTIDHPREILKENNDTSVVHMKRSTPSKFRNMFSSSKIKDELVNIVRDRNMHQRKRRKSITRPLHSLAYSLQTSTPRKSRIHFDQQRRLEQILNESNSSSGDYCKTEKFSIIRGENGAASEKFTKWRQTTTVPSTDSCTTSDSNSPCVAEKEDAVLIETTDIATSAATTDHQLVVNKRKDRRTSFILRGNMFARRKPTAGHNMIRDLARYKSKQQRTAFFNKFRKSLTGGNFIKLRKSILDRLSNAAAHRSSIGTSFDDRDSNSGLVPWSNRDSIEPSTLANDSRLFEKLLMLKESNAPFEISDLNLTAASSSRQTSLLTLYSGSVIKNRKIPHINRTVIEKSTDNLQNRKITLIHIFKNWDKLDAIVKIICALCLISFINILFYIRIPW